MTHVSFEEFMAELETTFQSYADTNDIDKISVKGWVIEKLRGFGKNICDFREAVLLVENSRVLLPENFKSLSLALKIEGEIQDEKDRCKEIPFKKYVTNPAVWDSAVQEYVISNCESELIIESLIVNKQPIEHYMHVTPLSLVKGMQKSALDVDCYNLNPAIRNASPHQINITNRSLNANFKKGLIYLQYNSLPSTEDGEIAIPILTTGDILRFIENYTKIRIAEQLIANNRNPNPGLQNLLQIWFGQDRLLEIKARSEANWSGLAQDFAQKMYAKNRQNQNRYNLPK
jgi:hypothetical protein